MSDRHAGFDYRLAGWIFLLGAAVYLSTAWNVCQVRAQETDAAAETEAAQDEGATSTAEEGGATETAAPLQKSMLSWVIETSGWIGAVLLVLSLYFVATTTRMFVELRPQVTTPPDVKEMCDELLKQRDFMGLYKCVQEDDSFFSQTLAAGIAELPQGLPEARDAAERLGEMLTVEMEKKISMLAVLGSLGPMIGLLGTLKGMIASFSVIALSDTQLKASQVAEGISEALVLTFEGVGLSVPAIYFFAVFRSRVSSLTTSALLTTDEFLRRMHQAMRPRQAPAAPVSPATAAAGRTPVTPA